MFKREKKIKSLGTISSFMNREHHKKAESKREYNRANKFATSGALLPLGVAIPSVFASAKSTFAASPEVVLNATDQSMKCMDYVAAASVQGSSIPVNALTNWSAGKATEIFATMLQPLIDIMLAISFPLASVMIISKLFLLFFGKKEECWSGIMSVATGYCLVQMSPIILDILKGIGAAF